MWRTTVSKCFCGSFQPHRIRVHGKGNQFNLQSTLLFSSKFLWKGFKGRIPIGHSDCSYYPHITKSIRSQSSYSTTNSNQRSNDNSSRAQQHRSETSEGSTTEALYSSVWHARHGKHNYEPVFFVV